MDIVIQGKVPTESEKGASVVATNIAKLCKTLLEKVNMTANDIVGIGMGVPGMIDGKKGEVIYSNNLDWEHFLIVEEVEKQTGLSIKIPCGGKEFVNTIAPKIKELFGIDEVEKTKDCIEEMTAFL